MLRLISESKLISKGVEENMKTSCYIGVTIVNHWCPETMQACCRARGNVMIVASLQLTVSCYGWEHLQLQLLYIYEQSENKQQCNSFSPGVPDPDHEYGFKKA